MQAGDDSGSARAKLVEGNRRFVGGYVAGIDPAHRAASLSSAQPVAAILGCADSRVPPEVVFDQEPGQLFVVRVAGNVPASAEIGSIEYAVARWRCPLVVVLGHTQCSAIAAAMDPSPQEVDPGPDVANLVHFASLLVSVRSSLAMGGALLPPPAAPSDLPPDMDDWTRAVLANVRWAVRSLRDRSGLMHEREASGELAIAGALYDVETGVVHLVDS